MNHLIHRESVAFIYLTHYVKQNDMKTDLSIPLLDNTLRVNMPEKHGETDLQPS